MGITASDIITLAQNTKALTKEQLAKILELAPNMTAGDLEKLKQMILSVQEAELNDMQKELDARQNVAAKYKAFKAGEARRDRTQAEENDRAIELQNISTLI